MSGKAKDIEEMLKKSKRRKVNIDTMEKNQNYDEIRKKLEEERRLNYSDFTDDEVKVINLNEDLKEFDYFLYDSNEENSNNVVEEDELGAQELDFSSMVSNEPQSNQNEMTGYTKVGTVNDTVISHDSEPIISFENIELKYGKQVVVKNVSFHVFPGEFVYLVGKSGAGKSSLLKMVYREVKNTKGATYVDGENVTRYRNYKLPKLRRKIGVVFQDFKLLKDKTVYENVKYTLDVIGYPRKDRKDKVYTTLKKIGMIEYKDKFPGELSGGQQQRVAIARALVTDPKILVADEPTGNLDPENALSVMEVLRKINSEGTTILMATHDVGIVNKYPGRVLLFKNGALVNETEGRYIYE